MSAGPSRLKTSPLVYVLEQGWVWFVCPRFGLRRDDSWADELLLLLLLLLLTRPGFVSCTEFRGPHAKEVVGRSPTVPLCGCIETVYHCSCCCCCWRKQARWAEQIDCARKTVPRTRPCCGGLSRPVRAQHRIAPRDWKKLRGSPDREAQP